MNYYIHLFISMFLPPLGFYLGRRFGKMEHKIDECEQKRR